MSIAGLLTIATGGWNPVNVGIVKEEGNKMETDEVVLLFMAGIFLYGGIFLGLLVIAGVFR